MMRKLGIGILLLAFVLMFSGCDDSSDTQNNEITDGWVNASTEWTDSDDSQLSYVDDGTDIWIDIGWYTNPSDWGSWVMGYIEEFTYSEGVLTGKYTSHQNPDLSEYAISITFSYADPTLTAVIVAGGVLGNKTLTLTAVP